MLVVSLPLGLETVMFRVYNTVVTTLRIDSNLAASSGRSKGIGNPSPSFGAGVSRVPAPIFTEPQSSSYGAMYSQSVREPLPAGSLPSIAQTLSDGHDHDYSQDLTRYSQKLLKSYAVQVPQNVRFHINGNDQPMEPQGYGDAESYDPVDINPYAHRADEIGPTHHIPGVGHLGDLLQPPDWREGDEPIDPRTARLFFNEGRLKAKETLKASIDETKNLPAEQQEMRNAERDRQWDTQFRLDQLLLTERIYIYDAYQERKRIKLSRGNLKRASPTRVLPPIQPQPVNKLTSVPARLQSIYSQSTLSSPDLASAGPPQNGLHGVDRGLLGMQAWYVKTP